jgi:hypothetical protein
MSILLLIAVLLSNWTVEQDYPENIEYCQQVVFFGIPNNLEQDCTYLN